MGLFPAALGEAKEKGIDLTPRYIPAEVFDERAVDKGQVVFYDVSFVEATPRYAKKNKLALAIELTDFSVYYSQGAAEAAIAAMREGKSEVLCEEGELVEYEDRWTGGYIFENEWQSFRTRKNRELELTTAEHLYQRPGRYTAAVKVIDIFGNDTMTLVPVSVG
jgi:site-specific DNA-methyltransferase (adenine-specific)/adenine-specific DNA-methyltransferase